MFLFDFIIVSYIIELYYFSPLSHMQTVQFFLGTSYDKNDQPIKNTVKKIENCCIALANMFGGYTMSNKNSGGWMHNNKLIKDDTIVFTVTTEAEESKIKEAAIVLRDALNQSSVLVTRQETQADFI